MLYTTSSESGYVVDQALTAAPYSLASSFVNDLMWNGSGNSGSDLDALIADGRAGLAFVYLSLDGAPAYHTRLDSVANLDVRSLQHHGEQAVSLVRHFGNLPLDSLPRQPNAVTFALLPYFVVHYPGAWALPLALLAVMLWLGVLILGLWRRTLHIGGLLIGMAAFLVSLIATVAVVTLIWWLLRLFNPNLHIFLVGGLYAGPLYLLAFVVLTLAIVAAFHGLWRRWFATADLTMGVLAWWAVSLPNPRQVREWAKGMGKRAKTDRVDAKWLAQFAAQRQPPAQPPLAAEVSELDNLLARRHDLETMLRQEQNRLGELAHRPGVPQSVLTNLEQVIHALQQALQEMEAAIEQHLQQQAYLQEHRRRLLTIPGIGPKTVLPLLVLLLRWQTLTDGQGSDKGLTALVGLDPTPHASGSSVYQRPTISKMGDGEIRRLLYMGALGALRGHNPLHDFYDRLVGRGKAKKLALVAASRKLLTWAWAIFSTGTVWNPALSAA